MGWPNLISPFDSLIVFLLREFFTILASKQILYLFTIHLIKYYIKDLNNNTKLKIKSNK
jgi:hypothetical protein